MQKQFSKQVESIQTAERVSKPSVCHCSLRVGGQAVTAKQPHHRKNQLAAQKDGLLKRQCLSDQQERTKVGWGETTLPWKHVSISLSAVFSAKGTLEEDNNKMWTFHSVFKMPWKPKQFYS